MGDYERGQSTFDFGNYAVRNETLSPSLLEPSALSLPIEEVFPFDTLADLPSTSQCLTSETISSDDMQSFFPSIQHSPIDNVPNNLDDLPSSALNVSGESMSSWDLQSIFPAAEHPFPMTFAENSDDLPLFYQNSIGEAISSEQWPAAFSTREDDHLTDVFERSRNSELGNQKTQKKGLSIFEDLLLPLSTANEAQQSHISASAPKTREKSADKAPHGKQPKAAQEEPLSGVFCFQVNSNAPTIRQKARYSKERREQVKEIRSIGACLRCKQLKRPCSKESPCKRCLSSRSSSLFSWMDCVRTSLIDVSIYQLDVSQLEVLEDFRKEYMYLAALDTNQNFSVPFQWNIQDISQYVLKWLLSSSETNLFSMVGVMSSNQFTLLIAGCLGQDFATTFKILVFATSSLRSTSHFQSVENLIHMLPFVEISGAQLLKQLEHHVTPRRLGSLSAVARLALFLVLTGSIISATYYQQFIEDRPDVYAKRDHKSIKTRSKELVHILSHYLLLVRQRCIMKSDCANERALIANSHQLWNKRAEYSWIDDQLEGDKSRQMAKDHGSTETQQIDHHLDVHSADNHRAETGSSAPKPNARFETAYSETESTDAYSSDATVLEQYDMVAGWVCCQCGNENIPRHIRYLV